MSDEALTLHGEVKRVSKEERMAFMWPYVVRKGDGSMPLDTDGDRVDTPEAEDHLKRAWWDYSERNRSGDDMHVDYKVSRLRDAIYVDDDISWNILSDDARELIRAAQKLAQGDGDVAALTDEIKKRAAQIVTPTPIGPFASYFYEPGDERAEKAWRAITNDERRMASVVVRLRREPIAATNAA